MYKGTLIAVKDMEKSELILRGSVSSFPFWCNISAFPPVYRAERQERRLE